MKRVVTIAAVVVCSAPRCSRARSQAHPLSGAARESAPAAVGCSLPMHPEYRSDQDPARARSAACPSRRFGQRDGGRQRHNSRAPAWRGAGESRAAAGNEHPGFSVVTRLAGTRLLRTTGRVYTDENRTLSNRRRRERRSAPLRA